MRTRDETIEDDAEARVRMLRAALEKAFSPSEYKRSLLLDVIETYCPVPEGEQERWEELLSREENRAVRDFERTWAERLMLTGFIEGKRQTLKRQLSIKFGHLPAGIEGLIDEVSSENELDGYLDRGSPQRRWRSLGSGADPATARCLADLLDR